MSSNSRRARGGTSSFLLAAALAPALGAAALRGSIVDNFSGRPLARALVSLEQLQGLGVKKLATRTSSAGSFAFSSLGAGVYLLTASQVGFATCKYGQKAWNAPGTPIVLEQEAAQFLQIRLRRLGGITGVIWDENDVGFPHVEVVACKATRPPKIAARARSDDRGVFRIGELEPGEYLVRSGAKQLEDGAGLLPTFHQEVQRVEEARVVEVHLEEDTPDVIVRPAFGKLFRLSGTTAPPGPVTVTLSSDVMRVTSEGGAFRFDGLPPGPYEIHAAGRDFRGTPAGDWQELRLDRDLEGLVLSVRRGADLRLSVETQDGAPVDSGKVRVALRKKDLYGEGEEVSPVSGKENVIAPGRWEIKAWPTPEYYAWGIGAPGRRSRRLPHADRWEEIRISPLSFARVEVVLSAKPAVVRGRVSRSLGEPAAGTPVFLEAIDSGTGRRIAEPRFTYAGTQGEYRFSGVPPGQYRIVSTFEFDYPDERAMEAAKTRTLVITEGSDNPVDLDLYVRP